MLGKVSKEIPGTVIAKLDDMRKEVSDRVVTMSGGAILLTFTVLQLTGPDVVDKMLIKLSWIFFGIAILLGLIRDVIRINRNAYIEAAKSLTPPMPLEEYEDFFKTEIGGQAAKLWRVSLFLHPAFSWIEIAQLSSFAMGIFLIVIFGFLSI